MLKLNRKGYLTIEIILASAIAFVIAFFLIDITMKLVDKTDNYYVDTVFMTDKALITKNIKELIQNDINDLGIINNVECDDYNKKCNITFKDGTTNTLVIDKDKKQIKYGGYTKKFDTKLSGNVGISVSTSNDKKYIVFYMKFTNIFEGNDYDIIIPIVNENNVSNEGDNSLTKYTVTINRQLGTESATATTISTLTVNKGSNSSVVSVTGTSSYPTYESISCTNSQTASVIKTTSNGIDTAKVTVNNVTSDTVCTAKFSAPTVYYSVQIKKQVNNGTATTVETVSVSSGGSYSTTVSGGNYYAVDSVSCTNSQNATVSETFSGVVVNAYFSINNVTNDTVCTIKMIS